MSLADLIRAVDTLSIDEFELLYAHIMEQRERRRLDMAEDRPNDELNINDLRQIFAELRDGFSESDLDDLDWAMNLEVKDSEWLTQTL